MGGILSVLCREWGCGVFCQSYIGGGDVGVFCQSYIGGGDVGYFVSPM